MKIKGIKRTITELNTCPAGYGLLLKLDLQRMEVITSELVTASSGSEWSKLKLYELDFGFYSKGELTMKDLQRVCEERIAMRIENYELPEEARKYAKEAQRKLYKEA